ncbi:MAG TPA: EAL domain-containing protein [Acidimicrobiales bacterium]|nr:EAL domain-containing protein [Acidimicrobiales bacterium]
MTISSKAPEQLEVVLLVDDDETMRQTLVDVLGLEGIETITAGRVDDARKLVLVHAPAVVVVDYQLPDGSGIELAQDVKRHDPEIPVLLLTGYATLDTAIAAVGQLDAYLIKPVAPRQFQKSVGDALTRRRLLKQNRDLVDRLKQINAYQAMYDPLTGLLNRALLDDRLEQSVALGNRTGRSVALFFLDLDRFKVVNDLFGHQVGDKVLQEVARRLTESCRKTDSVARFGGDEFVVICSDVRESTEACAIAQHLLDAFVEPIDIDGSDYGISASVGIAMTVPGSRRNSAETLLRNADTAMYRAKEGGRGRWELFDDEMRAQVRERFEIERELPVALATDALLVLYQALVDPSTDQVVGAEALLRWDRPGHGRVLPEKFLPVAEDCGLVTTIGTWVLERATADLARWRAENKLPPSFRLWVNVSPQQLADPNFPALVVDLLTRHALPPDLLGIEILEEALLDVGVAEVVMRSLRDLGVSLSLDDFGAGYSNFSWLQDLPISGIKVDRRFISTLDSGDTRGVAIVQGLVDLGHSLDLYVVAEGVETAEQARALHTIGCESVQGFFYGQPAPADTFWRRDESARADSLPAAR